ncbi:hypothetical protein [Nocardia wallacei]|uniref:hypothetical protein n=1 Tax=Nocardia wallacei TaxID=480035 RepID=UPI002456E965|nr:hypothetical protein [Nocardia wallacei]
MNEGPQNWLYTTPGEQQVAVPKSPVVSFPFGRVARPGSSPATPVSVDDPRAIHGRISSSAQTDAADEEETEEATASTPWSSLRQWRARNSTPEPSGAGTERKRTVAPMPQAQAVAQVRKHILGRDSGRAAAGNLVTERFSVGWKLTTPEDGGGRDKRTYYVADDGELEETSFATDASSYLRSVEQRFWQRQAMFG